MFHALLQSDNMPLRDFNLSPAQLALCWGSDSMFLPCNWYSKLKIHWSPQPQQPEKTMPEQIMQKLGRYVMILQNASQTYKLEPEFSARMLEIYPGTGQKK